MDIKDKSELDDLIYRLHNVATVNDLNTAEKINLFYDIFEELSFKYQMAMSKSQHAGHISKRKQDGIFYTPVKLARKLTSDALTFFPNGKNFKLLEPSAGIGVFVLVYLELISAKRAHNELIDVTDLLSTIYVAEKDEYAVSIFKRVIPSFCRVLFGQSAEFPIENIMIGSALQDGTDSTELSIREKFGVYDGFDLILANPPYRTMKPQPGETENDRQNLNLNAQTLRKNPLFSDFKGMTNLYKYFMVSIMRDWLKTDGVFGVVIPTSLLRDSQSEQIRRELVEKFNLGEVITLNEKNEFFSSIGQSFSVFSAMKGQRTNKISFVEIDEHTNELAFNEIDIKELEGTSRKLSMMPIATKDRKLLNILKSLPTVSDVYKVKNLRGELDLTLDKRHISEKPTKYTLLRGSNIGHYLVHSSSEYVSAEFFPRPKGIWVEEERIACQQISNRGQARRMKWALIKPDYVLANSCNFLALDNSNSLFQGPEIDLKYLLAVMNSELMNYRFKILSSNNHVSNSEIDQLPLVIPEIEVQLRISNLVDEYFKTNKNLILKEIDKIVLEIFQIEPDLMQ